MTTAKSPLPLPPGYNPETHLQANTTENGIFHETRKGAHFAQNLAANGTPQDLALAEKVLDVILGCQERHPDDAHYGNFYWMIEDKVVFDLNAVEFNLEHLIPMMLEHGERLSDGLRQRTLEAIRLGLKEIERLNVLPVYTNITLLDVLNTCLGGQLLRDERIIRRGYEKLITWIQLTAANGTPYEFNSPTYTSVDIRALKILADLTNNQNIRVHAQTSLAQLGLSVALHVHPTIGRWAGPHGRAYQPTIACETRPEIEMLREWVADGTLPSWIMYVLENRPNAMQVDETSFAQMQTTQTTYHSPSFSLGTSSHELTGQSNVLIGHYLRPGAEKPGVIYTRYLTNEKWLGDFYHATDRTKSRNLIDEGSFWGVQQGSRAIGLYSPANLGVINSAKAVIIWTGSVDIDEIWIGTKQIDTLPADIVPGEAVVIGSGNTLTAVLPLNRTDMGRAAPIRLREIKGDLVLEIYNYLGPDKSFWEMGWPGAFYKGQPQCGFYLEMAEKDQYADGNAFGQAVKSGTLTDQADEPFVYSGDHPRRWQVSYSRDEQELGLAIDLMEWKLFRRWTHAGELGYPMLEAPQARQDTSGEIHCGEAILRWGKSGEVLSPAWLYAAPEKGFWAAGYTGMTPVPLSLKTPEGKVDAEIACGTLIWDNGKLTINTIDI